MVVGVVSHDHREGPFERRGHDVGSAGELASAQMNGLVHGAALEEVVALVRTAPGVEEREHAGDEQRRLVVRDGIGSGEDRGRLAVLAVRIGEEERIDGRETLVQPAALAHETPLDGRAVVEARLLGGDEVVGLDVHADAAAVAERAVAEHRGAVDPAVVADADLADEASPDDPAAASHLAQFRGALLGVGADHRLQRRDGLRAVAVDGQHVGDLRRQTVEDGNRAATAFVHRGHRRAVAEGRARAAFERRDALDGRTLADAVVPDARTDDAGSRVEDDASLQPALQNPGRRERLRNLHRVPVLGRVAEAFECGDFVGGQFAVRRHRSGKVMQMQI